MTDLPVTFPHCCGLDVHKKSVTACARVVQPNGTVTEAIQTFSTMTRSLLELSDWLDQQGVTDVAMESTGVYWKPVWNLLEGNFRLALVNPAHMKALPGRKTDVKDAEWIAYLYQHGLLRASFIPDRPQRELRELTRTRTQVVRMRADERNRLQRTLEGANIKLGDVVSDVGGVSARHILHALAAGETAPKDLAELAVGRLVKKRAELAESLTGLMSDHQRFMIAHHLHLINTFSAEIDHLSNEIETRLDPFESVVELLCSIPGVGRRSAEIILAEIGLDMKRFPTAGHLASWAGMTPGHHQSAGKRTSGRTRKGNTALRSLLTQCANAASRCEGIYFAEAYRRIARRRGSKRAALAVGRMILETCYRVLSTGEYYDDTRWQRPVELTEEERLVRRLEKLGHKVTLEPAA